MTTNDEKQRANFYIDAELYQLFADLAPRREMSHVVERLMYAWVAKEMKKTDNQTARNVTRFESIPVG